MTKNCQIINIIIRETMKRGQVNAYEVKKDGKKRMQITNFFESLIVTIILFFIWFLTSWINLSNCEEKTKNDWNLWMGKKRWNRNHEYVVTTMDTWKNKTVELF